MEVEVECWENQRYVVFKGWGPYRLVVDRPLWSNKKGNETCCKQSTLVPGGWAWAGEWHVEPHEKAVEGWYYAPDFTIPTRFCSSKPGGLAIVRRRKWRRVRVQVPATGSGGGSPGVMESSAPTAAVASRDVADFRTWAQTLFYGFFGAGVDEQRSEQLRSHLSYYRLSSLAAKASGAAGVAAGLGQADAEAIEDDSPHAGEPATEDMPLASSPVAASSAAAMAAGTGTGSLTAKHVYHLYKYGLANVLRATLWPHWLGVSAKRASFPKNTFAELSQAAVQAGASYPAANEIGQDVVRTAPRHPFFDGRGSHGAMCLTNTLLAMTQLSGMPEYHQAFSYLAAVLLLNMPPEEAFWAMACVLQQLLPIGFHEQYRLQLDLRIFAELFAEKFPELEAHFQSRQIDLSVFATGWIQGLFCAHFPFGAASRFFDVMFMEGNSSLLVRVLLAFVKVQYDALRTMDSSCSLGQFANDWARQQYDVEALVAVCAKDGLGQTVLKRRFALAVAPQ